MSTNENKKPQNTTPKPERKQTIINNASLAAVAVKKEQYPDSGLPELAFVGKSNVGKSSLINSMLNRKALARTSQTPGKTRTINFYNVENKLHFVDLPGYGYAKAPKSEMKTWGKMMDNYLLKREYLRAIILLIDIRHPPSVNDVQMFEWLNYYDYPTIIVATKSDKLNRSQIPKHLKMLREKLKLTKESLIVPFSTVTKNSREDLWEILNDLVDDDYDDYDEYDEYADDDIN